MSKLYEKKEFYTVNMTSGIPGVAKTVEELLRRVPRIQSIFISSKNLKSGKGIECIRLSSVETEEDLPIRIDLKTLTPAHILSNCESIQEIFLGDSTNPLTAICKMLEACNIDQYAPIAWVVSGTRFWEWLEAEGISWKNKEDFFGYTVYNDVSLPQDSIILCAADTYACNLVDTRKAYKLLMPWKPGTTDFSPVNRTMYKKDIDPLEDK